MYHEVGHKAVDCILLARGIYILKYMQTHRKLCEQIASNWKDKNMPEKSVKVAQTYLGALPQLDMDTVIDQLDFSLEDILNHTDE